MTTLVIQTFTAAFPGQITLPDATSAFEAESQVPWSQSCWQSAAAYIQLKSAEDVSQALTIVKKTGTKFAVRSTGHNPNVGFSSVDGEGVVLDIRQLQSKELDAEGVARCGAGNTWGEVYSWLEEKNLSAIGGRDRQVGLAGFLLGGGLGAFPNLHGVGVDGVKNFEIVLADGKIINANANENPDLYCALKGGGANFGIVTRFDLETHPLIPAQYTINLYKPDDYVGIIKATIHVQDAMEKDPKIGLFTNFNAGFTAVGLCYADHPKEEVDAFKPFHDLDSLMMNACSKTDGTLLSLAVTMGHAQEPKNRYCGTLTTKVSQELYEAVYGIWQDVLKTVPEGGALHYTIQPIGAACVREGVSRGGNILGFEAVSQCWWVFTCEWPKGKEEDDAAARKAIHAIVDGVKRAAEEKALLLDYLSANFAFSSQKVIRSYGPENTRTLETVAAKYDSQGVFQKLQNNGFKLRDDA